jgi:hypothetical protein
MNEISEEQRQHMRHARTISEKYYQRLYYHYIKKRIQYYCQLCDVTVYDNTNHARTKKHQRYLGSPTYDETLKKEPFLISFR